MSINFKHLAAMRKVSRAARAEVRINVSHFACMSILVADVSLTARNR